jgi:hypothetical protein
MVLCAAPTAAIASVPKTRMAPKGGATAKVEAAAPVPAAPPVAVAPAKKSPVMMIVGAVVVLGGIGVGVMFMNKGGGTTTAPKVDAAVQAPAGGNTVAPPVDASKSSADPSKTAAQTSSTQQKDPGKLTSKAPTSAPAVTTNPPVSASTPVVPASETIAKWQKVVNSNPSATDATNAIEALNPLIEKLSGQERSTALYVEMVAYVRLDDDEQVCRVTKAILAGNPDDSRAAGARDAQKGRNCK